MSRIVRETPEWQHRFAVTFDRPLTISVSDAAFFIIIYLICSTAYGNLAALVSSSWTIF